MYALVAAVVVATPAAYAMTAATTANAVDASESENTATLHTVNPAAMTHRRPARSDTNPMTGRTARVVSVWTPKSHPIPVAVRPNPSRP